MFLYYFFFFSGIFKKNNKTGFLIFKFIIFIVMSTTKKSNKILYSDVSEYYQLLNKVKLRDTFLNNTVFISYCNNNIFSFNKKNLQHYNKLYKNHERTKNIKKKKEIDENMNVDDSDNNLSYTETEKNNIMKYIIQERKQQLKPLIKDFISPERRDNDMVIQNILKYEFLGFVEILLENDTKSKQYKYPIFVYYIGDDNSKKSLDDIKNWKILNITLLSSFHFTFKAPKNLEFLKYGEDKSLLFDTPLFLGLDTKAYNKLGYDGIYFKKPEYDANKDIDNIKMMALDPRFFFRYIDNNNKKRKPKDDNDISNNEHIKKKKKLNDCSKKNTSKNNDNTKKEKITTTTTLPLPSKSSDSSKYIKTENTDYNGLKYTFDLSQKNNSVLTVDDWSTRLCGVPTNSSFDMQEFCSLLSLFNTKKNVIEFHPYKILDALIYAHSTQGVIDKAIIDASKVRGITIPNENIEKSELINSILNDKETQEKLRSVLFQHINAVLFCKKFSEFINK